MTTSTALENWERDVAYASIVSTSIALGPARPIDYFKTSPVIWLSMLQGMRSLLALTSDTTTTTTGGAS